jgi:hypothetical protein
MNAARKLNAIFSRWLEQPYVLTKYVTVLSLFADQEPCRRKKQKEKAESVQLYQNGGKRQTL